MKHCVLFLLVGVLLTSVQTSAVSQPPLQTELAKLKFGPNHTPPIPRLSPIIIGTPSIETYVTQDFEGAFPPTGWSVINTDAGTTWEDTIPSSYGIGARSVFVDCYDYSSPGELDSLLTPVITGLVASDSIIFDYAYTDYSASFTDDSLIIDVSTDGGASFASIWREGGANLRTAPSTTNFFVPTSSQWATRSFPVPAGAVGNNVVVSFTCRNNYGNNLYLDNVRIGHAGPVPLTGIKTIPGNYPSLAAAIADLNLLGVGPGGVTFDVAAGYTETLASLTAGLITATGTASDPIIFQKSGVGANPLMTAFSPGVSTTVDYLIAIAGGDYITFDGIDLQENALNTTPTQQMEWGYALVKKQAVAPFDGCQNVTVKNCTITLNRANTAAVGIYLGNHVSTSTTSLTITATTDAHNNNRFYHNTIQNCNSGITISGFAAATPYTLYDQNNDVGGTSALTGNTIRNYGGTATTAYGAYGLYQNNLNVQYNTISDSADAGGAASGGTLYGVFHSTGTNSSTLLGHNTVTMTKGANTSSVYGIASSAGGTGTSIISNNTLVNWTCNGSSGAMYFIYSIGTTGTVHVDSNTISNNTTLNTTGTIYGIYNSNSTPNITCLNNIINNVAKTGAGGTFYGYYNFGSPAGGTSTHGGNSFTNITLTGATAFYGIYQATSTTQVGILANNTISNVTSGASAMYGLYFNYGSTGCLVNGNTVSNLSGGGIIYGINLGSGTASQSLNAYGNTVNALNTSGASTVYGIYDGVGLLTNIYKNNVYDLQANNAAGIAYGIHVNGGSASSAHSIYNNFISDLRAPATSAAEAVRGISITSATVTSTINVSYNSIYLNASSTGANFGTSGIYHTASATGTTATLNLRNNVIVNTSTPAGTGLTVAYRRSGTALTNYATASNSNDLYAGVPSATRLIFYDGTNSDSTVTAYKARVSPSDGNSFAEDPPFINAGAHNLHMNSTIATQCESGGVPVAGITDDFDGDTRNANTPDVGADEFEGIAIDLSAPLISYTPLANTNTTGARTLTSTIVDASGVPTSGIGLPVLYWRINSGAYTGATGSFVSGSSYTFTLGAGAIVGDTVSYFIAAQDIVSSPNVGVYPSAGAGGFTANPPAAATPPTNPSRYLIVQPPLSGDYTVGLTLFNRIAGTNITFEKSVRKVMKEVVVPVPVSNQPAEKGKENLSSESSTSLTPAGTVQQVEVEEVSWIPMENGKVYEGNLYVKKDEQPNLDWPASINGVYPTITAAVADLDLRGVSGHTRFLLNDSTFTTETFPITVNILSSSLTDSGKTLTIRPNTGVTAAVRGAAASAQIFKILNSYVNIDGSNSGGSTRNLTIENTSATTPQVIVIGSTGAIPIRNCTVKNCNIINGINSSSALIVSDGAAPGTAGWFNNITIQNNTIQKAYIANYNIAVVSPGNGAGLNITGNDLTTAGANSFRLVGAYVQGIDGATVSNNSIGNVANTVDASNITGIWIATGTSNSTISGNTISVLSGTSSGPRGIAVSTGVANANLQVINNTVSNLTTPSSGTPYGIYLFSTTTGVTIERNKVSSIYNTNTGGYGARAIHVNTGIVSSNVTLKNNFVWDVKATADFGTTYWGIGIGVEGATGGVNVYYNSVNLYGSLAGYSSGSGTIHTAFGVLTSTAGPLDVRDNIFVNTFNNTNQTIDKSYAINSQAPNTAFTSINYNDYLAGDSAGVLGYLGSDQTTLAAWRTATGQDVNSISATPNFVDPTNLHIIAFQPSPVDSAATPIAGITTDIDGQTRNATRPDIGADEFSVIGSVPIGILSVARNTRVPLAGDSIVVTARIIDSLAIGITADSLLYSLSGTLQPAVGMLRISGSNTDGVYSGVIPGTANTNGARVEYQIKATGAGGLTKTTAVVAANSYFGGVSSLSPTGVRSIGPNRQLLYPYYCRVTGTVNSPNFTVLSGRISYMFQDAIGGMNVNRAATSLTFNLGDSIVVLGLLGQFRGTTQLTPDSLTDISVASTGRPLVVTDVSVNAYNANPELYESRLIRFTNLQRLRPTPVWGNNVSIPVYQNVVADSTLMFLDADTPVPSLPEPTYPVAVTGVAGQFTTSASVYNDGYEIIPRSGSDFVSGPSGLSGSYTVGAGGSFPTLDSAMSALRTLGVTGPVTFSLTDSLYRPVEAGVSEGDAPVLQGEVAAEMDPLDPRAAQNPGPRIPRQEKNDGVDLVGQINIIGPIAGASATNRITIRPATGVRARIVGTGAATFNLSNASFITFNGIGLSGSTQMTVENSASGGVAFAVLGNSDNAILQNMTIRAPYASGIGVYADTASGAAPDSTQILSNAIPTAYFGTYVRGGNFVIHGTRIMNNTVGSATDSIGAVGIYNQQVAGNIIANNYVQNVKDAVAAGGNIAGIWIATKQLNMQVYNNVINGVRNRPGATAAVFAAGVYHFGTTGDTSRSKYYNNMIYGLDNPSSGAATVRGMYLSTAIEDMAVYNSVYLTGTDVGTTNISAALYMSSASVGLTVKDNIAVNARTAAGTGRAIAFYISAAPTGLTTNYNDLYTPTQTGSHVAAIGTTNYTTLAAWKATGRDSQSVSVTPLFQSPDLHINTTIPTLINGGGTPIAGITTDIDGQTRNATTPDIGADEFTVGFFDDFEAYTVGQRLACQNPVNWTTWGLIPCSTVEDPLISSAFAFSGTKSVVITQNNDLVKRLDSVATGKWVITFKVYIPTSKAGYFNTLAGFTPHAYNWGLEAYFDSTGAGRLLAGSATAFPFTYTHNAWHTVKVVVNLNIDSAYFYLNSSLIRTWRWTLGASGGGSPLRIDGNDFFGATAWDQMFMDDYDFHRDTTIVNVGGEKPEIPGTFVLMQNYPNPFNPTTTLRYALPRDARVTLSIYNILGQRVATLRDEVENVGYHDVVWNGRNDFGTPIASGVYFYRIEARPTDGSQTFSSIKKMLMLK